MNLLKNIIYDYKAVRKYGLKSHIKYLFDIDQVIIICQTHLDFVPAYVPRPDYDIVEVDYNDDQTMQIWCEIVNTAFTFDKPYSIKSGREYLTNHSYKKIENLYFIIDNISKKPVGTYFIGVLRNNTNIGTSGRIAVIQGHQKKGLGRLLALFGYQKFKEKGIMHTEEVFYIEKDYSIRLFIKCGSVPQFQVKYMQLQPTRKNFLVTWLARRKVKKLYNDFRKDLMKPYLSNIQNT